LTKNKNSIRWAEHVIYLLHEKHPRATDEIRLIYDLSTDALVDMLLFQHNRWSKLRKAVRAVESLQGNSLYYTNDKYNHKLVHYYLLNLFK
jgi:hypothetical protein